jgi:YD repeat-containing protein
MRMAAELNLKGTIRSVEMYRVHASTRSYRLLADGNRELLQEYGDPSTIASSPLLFSLTRFDEQGRLIEDIEVDRPLIEQEAYRKVYEYDERGRVVEINDYDEDNNLVMTWRNVFGLNGKKLCEEGWSPTGLLLSRSDFDDHENLIQVTWFRGDGTSEREQKFRYEYSERGNVTEQLLFPADEATLGYISRVSFYTPFKTSDSGAATTAVVHRSVFTRADDGSLREVLKYWPDGSLREKRLFDEHGVLREERQSSGASDLTVSKFDSNGRILQMTVVAPAGFLSSRETDDVTTFAYDVQGNLIEMNTTASDGSLIRRTTNAYRYDEKENWIEREEVELNQTWQTEPFPSSFETICQFTRNLEYFGT